MEAFLITVAALFAWLLGYNSGELKGLQRGYKSGRSDGYDAGIVDAQINAWKKDCARRNRAGQFTSKK